MRLRLCESAIASRSVFSPKIRDPATFDFCNTIGQQQTFDCKESSTTISASLLKGQAIYRTTPATCLRWIRRNPLYENFNYGSPRVIVGIDRIVSESGKREIKRLDEGARCKVVGDNSIAA